MTIPPRRRSALRPRREGARDAEARGRARARRPHRRGGREADGRDAGWDSGASGPARDRGATHCKARPLLGAALVEGAVREGVLVERETGWTSLRPTPAPRGHVLLLEPRDQLDLEPGSHAVVFVHNGWLCRSRVLPHGARQIIELLLTGDHHVSRPETAGDTLSALSRCEVSRVPASELQRAMDASETLRKVIVDAERRRSTILEERLVSPRPAKRLTAPGASAVRTCRSRRGRGRRRRRVQDSPDAGGLRGCIGAKRGTHQSHAAGPEGARPDRAAPRPT